VLKGGTQRLTRPPCKLITYIDNEGVIDTWCVNPCRQTNQQKQSHSRMGTNIPLFCSGLEELGHLLERVW